MPSTAVTEKPGLSWEELCTNPQFSFLHDLPFKIETNKWGQIVMSPTRFKHSIYQKRLIQLLDEHVRDEGEAFPEASIETPEGVKVPDVAWLSAQHVAEARDEFAVSRAPEICVEVLSPWNAWGEIEEKIGLYLGAGAAEAWVCDLDGRMHFFDRNGERARSARVPDFPARIEA